MSSVAAKQARDTAAGVLSLQDQLDSLVLEVQRECKGDIISSLSSHTVLLRVHLNKKKRAAEAHLCHHDGCSPLGESMGTGVCPLASKTRSMWVLFWRCLGPTGWFAPS